MRNKISLFGNHQSVIHALREKEATFAKHLAAVAEIAVSFLPPSVSQSAMVHIAKAKIMFMNMTTTTTMATARMMLAWLETTASNLA